MATSAKTAPRVRPLMVCWIRTSYHSIGSAQSEGASTAPSEASPRKGLRRRSRRSKQRAVAAARSRHLRQTVCPTASGGPPIRAAALPPHPRGEDSEGGRSPPPRLKLQNLDELELALLHAVAAHHLRVDVP